MYQRKHINFPIIRHLGIFKKQIGMWEAVALIVSGTVGAGVLGIPFAISKIGIGLGVLYILAIGCLMMGLHLLLGSVAAASGKNIQLAGLAERYLGQAGRWAMTILFYLATTGILVVYIIGEGEALAALFGGSTEVWSALFFIAASALVTLGLRTVKWVELALTAGIFIIVLMIATTSAPHVNGLHFRYYDIASLLLPYGVILFAFSAASAIPEAHSILLRQDGTYKKAIVISSIVSMVIYTVFAVITVGVTGRETTELATIGLGNTIGPIMTLFGNVFAALAMGTSFLVVGLAMRDSLHWDFKLPKSWASVLTIGIPFFIFSAGIRGFVAMIDFVGGVLISLELVLIVLIYWRAKQVGDLKRGKFQLHHTWWLVVLLLVALTIGTVYSIQKMF